MSLSPSARARLDHFAPAILAFGEDKIEAVIVSDVHSHFRDKILSLGDEGGYSVFYAPFDWVNDNADIVIVGVTPGRKQASDALKVLRRALLAGKSSDEAAKIAKESASFKGGMRVLGARLMDHFRLNELFSLTSTAELFGRASARAHYTSALRYPVMKNLGNYSGDRRLLTRSILRRMVDEYLAEELAGMPNAWIVPFGPTALSVIEALAKQGIIDESRVLGGILHPGGQQWNRYNVQLGLVDDVAAAKVSGGLEVLRCGAMLNAKVRNLLDRHRSE